MLYAATMPSTPFAITPARAASDIQEAAALFRAYAASLAIDLSYQDFAAELASLPGKYAPPSGELLIARDEQGRAVGCVALRSLSPGACEMKRLYLVPAAQGRGIGKALAEGAVAAARRLGYAQMRLDTIPSMRSALAIYEGLGFRRIAPYYETPVEGTIFMALEIAP